MNGSSPRAWGTQLQPMLRLRFRRFIPTCVGNTSRFPTSPICASVHPHVRGEHREEPPMHPCQVGSSPRAWGTRHRLHRTRDRRAVHPHVRGEHSLPSARRRGVSGSSPRAWGTLPVAAVFEFGVRFIPTCVGNTGPALYRGLCPAVHPHVRGEHFRASSNVTRTTGSSPRAWGTLIG